MFKTIGSEIWAFDAEWAPDPKAGRLLYRLPDDMPDRDVMAEMWRRGGATEEEPQPYLKTILCRVVSIAAIRRKTEPDGSVRVSLMSLPHIGAGTAPDVSEAEILSTFLNAIGEHKPQLVGFNSHSADIKILIQRAIVNGVSAPEFCKRPEKPWEGVDYFARGGEGHIDLKEVVSGFGKGTPSLNELATLSGIPGKMDVDGKGVAEMWLSGDLKGIVGYNEHDALTTYLTWLRIAYFAGFFDLEGYGREQALVADLIRSKIEEGQEHLKAYQREWERLQAATGQV